MNNTENRATGFTLIEVMIVIGIIVLLAGLLIAAASPLRRRAQDASAKKLVQTVGMALEAYKLDFQVYPPNKFGAYSKNEALTYFLTSAFRKQPGPGEILASSNAGPYATFQPSELADLNGQGHMSIIDPWQMPLSYQLMKITSTDIWNQSAASNVTYYRPVVYSFGPNKTDDSKWDDSVSPAPSPPFNTKGDDIGIGK